MSLHISTFTERPMYDSIELKSFVGPNRVCVRVAEKIHSQNWKLNQSFSFLSCAIFYLKSENLFQITGFFWKATGRSIMSARANSGMTDSDIRFALHSKKLRRVKSHPGTLIIDELGLAHARNRIDVAVINGYIHGYEIKSSKDTLYRLTTQIEIYRQTLQKLTIVTAPKHIQGIMAHAPEWCGVIAAEQGPRGGISFHVLRNAAENPEIDPVMMAHLLWRDEVIDLLRRIGHAPKDLRRSRRQLYEMLCETMTLHEITASIRTFMAQRQAWRDRPAHA